jgi:hypothetical protein
MNCWACQRRWRRFTGGQARTERTVSIAQHYSMTRFPHPDNSFMHSLRFRLLSLTFWWLGEVFEILNDVSLCDALLTLETDM